MKNTIESILRSHGLLAEFLNSTHFHTKIENDPFMPLTIEKHSFRVMITHYYTQNGDLVPDPDMEFEILPDGTWRPVATQFAIGFYNVAVEYHNGVAEIDQSELKKQNEFAEMWAANLNTQGYMKLRIQEA